MDEQTITRMRWDDFEGHLHPVDVTLRSADGTEETMSADRLPFSIDGDVEMVQNNILVDDDIEDGERLACQALPLTDAVTVSFDDL